MNNLFLSFMIAIGGAIGLVTLSRTFNLEFYTTRIFPLIPIFYAIIYEILEKRKTGKDKPIPPSRAKEEMKAGVARIFESVTAGRRFQGLRHARRLRGRPPRPGPALRALGQHRRKSKNGARHHCGDQKNREE